MASAIRVTRARISVLTGGRPPVGRAESVVQWKRCRCRRTTVSGATMTMTRACLQPTHTLESAIQESRSLLRKFGRFTFLL